MGRDGEIEVLWAAELGEVATVQRLIEDGVDLECRTKYQKTPLMLAASEGHVDVVRLLIEAGADVQATDGEGTNALIEATRRPGSARVLEMLLTGLIHAVYSGSPAIVRRLLDAGADPNHVDGEGTTIRTHLTRPGNTDLIGVRWPMTMQECSSEARRRGGRPSGLPPSTTP